MSALGHDSHQTQAVRDAPPTCAVNC